MTALDTKEVAASAMGRAGSIDGAAAMPLTPPGDDAQEGAQRIWWYLLFAGLLLLTAETVVSNRSTV